MNIKELIKQRPHLESPINFYTKVREYRERCLKKREFIERETDLLSFVLKAFCSTFGIPEDTISFLLNEVFEKGIDPLSSPSSFLRLSFYHDDIGEEERGRMLFLLSKPFFLWLRNEKKEGSFTESGRCPICGEVPSIGRITDDNHKRLICTFCEHEGDFFRIGCPYCMNRESDKIEILLDEDEVRAELCGVCRSYIKSMREEHLKKYDDPHLVDVISLPLDVVVQRRGYIRRSPNLIGVREIK